MVVGGEHRDRGTGLGEPVGVDEPDLWQQLECLADQGKCDLRAAVGEISQRGQLDRFGFQRRHDAVQRGGYHGRRGDALVAHQPDPLAGFELAQVHHLSAGVQVGRCGTDARDVVRRYTDQRGVVGVGRVELDRAGDVVGQVVMGQLNGFGDMGPSDLPSLMVLAFSFSASAVIAGSRGLVPRRGSCAGPAHRAPCTGGSSTTISRTSSAS